MCDFVHITDIDLTSSVDIFTLGGGARLSPTGSLLRILAARITFLKYFSLVFKLI